MIMLMGVGVEGELKPPQTYDAAQLRADQRHHMIPALERFVVGIGVVSLHNFPKLPSIDWFDEVSKDAIAILHARHFLSLDNLKASSSPGFAGHAPRHSESFPGQPCACGDETSEARSWRSEFARVTRGFRVKGRPPKQRRRFYVTACP